MFASAHYFAGYTSIPAGAFFQPSGLAAERTLASRRRKKALVTGMSAAPLTTVARLNGRGACMGAANIYAMNA